MITDFFRACELHSRTEVVDAMGGKQWAYNKTSDISGTIIAGKSKELINGAWVYTDNAIFLTVATVTKEQRIKFNNRMYEFTGEPEDIMFQGHHFEIKVQLVD